MPIWSDAIVTFELFMTKWEKLTKDHPKLKPIIQEGLELVYKYYNKMDNTRAYSMSLQCVSKFLLTQRKLILFAVLNPTICMSWIRQNWENKWIDMAKSNIQELVCCLVFIFLDGVSCLVLKMQEYHEKSAAGDDKEQVAQVSRANATNYSHKDVLTYSICCWP
jgi:hypothetical protein